MVHVTRQFAVNVDQAAAIDYLKDFSNAVEWDPGTVACERIDDGPIRVGSRWHNTSKLIVINTELEYELTELRDDGLVFVGTNTTATSYDRINVISTGGGARLTYDATVTFNGKARYADPLMTLIFLKLARDTVRDLTRALEALPRR
ncbi:MAG: SRPBCC family protein [Actinobacteria bacterium]|nr:SRPBCC family protein [Actinomycetota bacterium]